MGLTPTRAVRVFGAIVLAVFVGACGGSSESDDAAPPDAPCSMKGVPTTLHNAQDTMFAQHMIPHHQQGVDMSAMVPSRTDNSTLHVVAARIKIDQQAEINILTDCLERWGEPLTGHAGHDGLTMPGMVDHDTMSRLETLKGAEFDTSWITAMIGHHQGAITMAQAELAHGESPAALRMARLIIATQEREIAYMTHMISATE